MGQFQVYYLKLMVRNHKLEVMFWKVPEDRHLGKRWSVLVMLAVRDCGAAVANRE